MKNKLTEKTCRTVIGAFSDVSGYYVADSRPGTDSLTQEQMAEFMTKEILTGCDGTDVKAGAIGEIGCSWPLMGISLTVVQSGLVTTTHFVPSKNVVVSSLSLYRIS